MSMRDSFNEIIQKIYFLHFLTGNFEDVEAEIYSILSTVNDNEIFSTFLSYCVYGNLSTHTETDRLTKTHFSTNFKHKK